MKQQQTKARRRALEPRTRQESPRSLVERMRAVWLAGLIAIYVARPLLPSESPTTIAGDGLPFVMLTLILATTWMLAQFIEPRPIVRPGPVDLSWIVLLACQGVSAWLTTKSGYPRAAINTFWEWTGLGIGYLLLRQVMPREPDKRATCMLFIGLALVLSLYGIFQFGVLNPSSREMYLADPDRILQEQGIDAPAGSAARRLFEERLRSSEPTATFALANSLAGFLTPWLLMTIGVGWLGDDAQGSERADRRKRWGAAIGCALPIALCLVLTKSRTGYLATLVGLAAIIGLVWRRQRNKWKIALIATCVLAISLAFGVASGALDLQVLTEAVKSMRYRAHYWHGAWCMVKEHPWFGCGPGNFQDEYARFKLPQASEVVADPHNFVFEIWATCGTPALAAFAFVLIGAFAELRRPTPRCDDDSKTKTPAMPLVPLVGGLLGLLLALVVGLISTVELPWLIFFAGLALLPAMTWLCSCWIRTGGLPRFMPAVCAAAMLVNLSAAGGIGFAGVAGSLWLLVAMMGRCGRQASQPLPKWVVGALVTIGLVLVGSCWWTAYHPFLECRRLLALADREPMQARQRILQAADADPWSDEPWRRLSAGDFAQWLKSPNDISAQRWQDDHQQVLRRRPHASAAWLAAADDYLAASHASAQPRRKHEYLRQAILHYRQAAELYPTSPLAHARLALALDEASSDDARNEAKLAVDLHDQTPHLDQKLPDDLAVTMRELARTAP